MIATLLALLVPLMPSPAPPPEDGTEEGPRQSITAVGPTGESLRSIMPFVVYDGLRGRDKPILGLPFAMVVGDVFTRESLRLYRSSNPPDPFLLQLDADRIATHARNAQRGGHLLVINIEWFPLDQRRHSQEAIERSMRVIARAFAIAREVAPGVRLGIYAMMPHRTYNEHIRLARGLDMLPAIEAWHQANERMTHSILDGERDEVGLVDLVDFVCPSVYLFYGPQTHSIDLQMIYVRENIRAARKYQKPVYPFVWSTLHAEHKPVPIALWAEQIRTVAREADGVILWEGSRAEWGEPLLLRTRAAQVIARERGNITNARLAELLKREFPTSGELAELAATPDLPAE
jgi:hypothetical protein